MIPEKVVDDIWKRMAQVPLIQGPSPVNQLAKQQPTVPAYIINSKIFWIIFISQFLLLCFCVDYKSSFVEIIIDKGPQHCTSMAIGDLDGDGKMDMIVGGLQPGGLVWYENTTFNKHIIDNAARCKNDAHVVDVDHDGDQDIVQLCDSGLVWIENPQWEIHPIDTVDLLDIEIADFDGDRSIDIVGRGSNEFDNRGDILFFYMQILPTEWKHFRLTIPIGAGLKVADVNADEALDIIINGYWLENAVLRKHWLLHPFAHKWAWSNTCVDAGDLNRDGRIDIIMSPTTIPGRFYRLAWFEAPKDPARIWKEHKILAMVETVLHFVAIADFDNNGLNDVVAAEMSEGQQPHEIAVYFQQKYSGWKKEVLSTNSPHRLCLLDADSDGDIDLLGADESEKMIKVWKNEYNKISYKN